MARLVADFWVRAYLARLGQANIPAYVVRRGDPTAGAVIVRVNRLDGTGVLRQRATDPLTGARHWMDLAEGEDGALDAVIARQSRADPDLWVIEIEAPDGRDLLDEPGLAD